MATRSRRGASTSNSRQAAAQRALAEEIAEEALEEDSVEMNGQNSIGNESPAIAQSPSRRNIADEQKLTEAIRQAKLQREKLSEIPAKDMENERIKKDKSLSLIRAYAAVDTELEVLQGHGYTVEVIEDRRVLNRESRNEQRGTTNDNLWIAYMSAAVETHRTSQKDNMDIKQIDLPLGTEKWDLGNRQ